MILFFHELTHLILSLLSGFFASKFTAKKNKYLLVYLFFGILAGLFIDLDHLFDYFLAFGLHFRLDYFLKGF